MSDNPVVTETDGTSTAHGDDPASEPSTGRRRRPGRLSLAGALLGLLFAAMSMTPSLVPRGWLVNGLLIGICAIIGYGFGSFLGWAYRTLHLPNLPPGGRRVAWLGLAAVAAVAMLVLAWFGRTWQGEQRELLGMDTGVSWLWLLSPLLGLAVAALLLGVGRLVKGLGRVTFRPLVKVLPVRVAWLAAIVVTVFVTWTVVSGLLVGKAVSFADSRFEGSNDDDKPGVVNPESPYRSGGPESTVTWESIGREGRAFIHQGPTASDIAGVVDDPAAAEPVRAFIGLEAAPTPRSGRRSPWPSCGPSVGSSGAPSRWQVAPEAAGSTRRPRTRSSTPPDGDVAIVSMQYSYLPSFMSFLVDRSRSATNAEQLITALRVELDGLAPDERPDLYVLVRAWAPSTTGSAFTSVEDMSTTTDGACSSARQLRPDVGRRSSPPANRARRPGGPSTATGGSCASPRWTPTSPTRP